MAKPVNNLTAAQAAQRLGLTVKALRVLERHGLIAPGRTAAGWRVYGPAELARLHQILALRRLGLGLGRIADLLRGRAADLEGTLAMQEEVLRRARAEADQALRLIRRARARLAEGGALSADDLTELIKETNSMTDMTQTPPELEDLIQRHYTPDQLDRLKARPFTAKDQARVSAAWSDIYQRAEALLREGADPASPAAQELACRSKALIDEFTGGNAGIAASLNNVWREAASRPTTQRAMPGSPEANSFLAQARAHLAGQGGSTG